MYDDSDQEWSSSLTGDQYPVWMFALALTPFVAAACCIRSFRNLAYLSFVGQALSGIGYVIIMLFAVQALVEDTPEIQAVNWAGAPIFFGMVRGSHLAVGGIANGRV